MAAEIGFIGVGRMGGPMARRLVADGRSLVIHDIDQAALRPLAELGARVARSPAEVASAAELVLVSLPTPDIVEGVALGPEGVAAGNRITTFVDLSTTGPRVARRVTEALAKQEIAAIDAPVSGGVSGAEKGTLAVMVSCKRADFVRVEPVLRPIGRVFHVGEEPGQGQVMKLANNMLSATAMAASSEAIVMGVKAGLDPAVMVEVLNAGSGRNSATQDKFPRSILPRRFDAGFAAGLMLKDLRLCLETAEAEGVPMWVGGAVRQLWSLAVNEFGADADITRIVQLVERWAKAEVKRG